MSTTSITRTVTYLRTTKVYTLSPSVTSIKVAKDGTYSPKTVTCKIRLTNGSNVTELSALPSSSYSMKYQIDSNTAASYTIGSSISVTSATTSVTFYLYCVNSSNVTTLVDSVTLGVVIDGVDGEQGPSGAAWDDFEGIYNWEDIADGTTIYADGDTDSSGNTRKAWVVLYGGYYWRCLATHTKASVLAPASSGPYSSYWKIYENFDLLSSRSIITDSIYMQSGDNVFSAVAGNVRCNTGTFENVTIRTKTSEEGGERLELSAEANALKIFNSDNEEVNIFSGATKTRRDLIRGSVGTITKSNSSMTSGTGYTISGYKALTNDFTVTGSGTVKITYSSLKVWVQWTYLGSSTSPPAVPSAALSFALYKKDGSTYTLVSTIKEWSVQGDAATSGSNEPTDTYSGSISVSVTAGIYQIRAVYEANLVKNYTVKVNAFWSITSITSSADQYSSEHFAQGMIFSQSTTNYVLIMTEDSKMTFEAMSDGVGLRLKGGALQVKTSTGSWTSLDVSKLITNNS